MQFHVFRCLEGLEDVPNVTIQREDYFQAFCEAIGGQPEEDEEYIVGDTPHADSLTFLKMVGTFPDIDTALRAACDDAILFEQEFIAGLIAEAAEDDLDDSPRHVWINYSTGDDYIGSEEIRVMKDKPGDWEWFINEVKSAIQTPAGDKQA